MAEEVKNKVGGNDLGMLEHLAGIEAKIKGQRRTIVILIALVVVIAAGSGVYLNMGMKAPEPDQTVIAELDKLKADYAELQMHANELQGLLEEASKRLESAEQGEEGNDEGEGGAEVGEGEAASADEPSTHLVKEGETLWTLAERYYGDGKYYERLGVENHVIEPQQLHAGMELTIFTMKFIKLADNVY